MLPCPLQLTTVDQPDGGSYTVEMTPLADAAARGNLDIVQVLVDGRAEVNAISEVGVASKEDFGWFSVFMSIGVLFHILLASQT